MINNKVINGLWIDGQLNSLQLLCIKSFLANGHEFHLYSYNADINAPSGTVVKSAGEVIPQPEIFVDDRGSLCSFADLFRYELLYVTGGVWVDMDMVCQRSFDFDSDFVFSSELLNYSHPVINIGGLKVPPRSEIMHFAVQSARAVLAKSDTVQWGILGLPVLKAYIAANREYSVYMYPPQTFCPVPPYCFKMLFADVLLSFTQRTYAVHFWNEMLRLNKMNPDKGYHYNSFYQREKNKYNIEPL